MDSIDFLISLRILVIALKFYIYFFPAKPTFPLSCFCLFYTLSSILKSSYVISGNPWLLVHDL